MSARPTAAIDQMERAQVPLYLGAIAAGAGAGLVAPTIGTAAEVTITPLLATLLYVTFLQVPAGDLARSLRDRRFLSATLVVNFLVAPLVVAALFAFVPDDRAIQIGVLLVLLCPCVDYVVVFTRLAGGADQRLLAATPVLLIAQMALLPVFLTLFLGRDLAEIVEVRPFLEAFVVLIAIPLALAWTTQAWAAQTKAGRGFTDRAGASMVPLMMAVLLVVVWSQIPRVDDSLRELAGLVPVYAGFLGALAICGAVLARIFGLPAGPARAVVFSGATRNSLVVLPLALALPAGHELAGAAVVTQTLVELVGMVVLVWAIPRLLPGTPAA